MASLEQRVALLESQLRSMSAKLQLLEDEHDELATTPAADPAPINAGPAPIIPPPGPPAPRWQNPDPAKTYRVPIDDSPAIGPNPAAVTIVASLQFPEPYSHKAMPILMQLRNEYRRDLRIVVKLFIVHPRMTVSSYAGCAAAYQDALEPMEVAIWDASQDQTLSPGSGMRALDETELRELARVQKLDLKQYDQDVATCKASVTRDQAVLSKLGQRGVPAFWINGRYLSGAQPIDAFKKVVEEELDKYRADRGKGGKAATYYDRIMKNAPTAP